MSTLDKTTTPAAAGADILIVDDHASDRRLLSDILSAAGYTVRPAGDGELALRSARARPPALALLDIRLPGMSGLELCRRLKADPLTAEVPVLFISALDDDLDKGRAFEAGGVDYITKPLRKEEVLARVRTHLAIDQSRRLLAQERDRARRYLDIAGVMIVSLDQAGKVTLINRKGCEVLGYEEAEVLGQSWFERFLPPADREPTREVFSQSILGNLELPEYYENPVITKSREERLVAWHNAVIRDASGAITGTLSSGEDITERRAAAEALRQSEATLRSYIDHSPLGVFVSDAQGHFVEIGGTACAASGYSEDELLTMHIRDLTDGVTQKRVAALFRSLTVEGTTHAAVNAEVQLLRKDGAKALWNISVSRLPDGRHLTFTMDVTERKAAAVALRESEARYRSLFDQVNDHILVLELLPDGLPVIRDANQAALRALGYTRGELIGKPILFIEAGASPEATIRQRQRSIREAGASTFEVRHRRKDGSAFSSEAAVKELTIGGRHMAISIERDLTVRNAAEEDRQQLMASLAQSDRLASMGLLAAGVAHELNNPLSYVLYNIESLVDDLPRLLRAMRLSFARLADEIGHDALDELVGDAGPLMSPAMLDDVQARFSDALDGTRRIRDVTRGLSTFSRVEDVQLAPVDLRRVIDAACNMSKNEIRYRARLVKDCGMIPTLLAGEGRLAQVLLNLIVNAAHAIDEGDVENNEIRVKTWSEGDDVFVEVRDTGCGIPPENLDKLFEPFFTTKEIGAGAGLGLAISKSIIERFGGAITVRSEVGKGSSFTVRLPIRAQEPAPVEAPSKAETEPRIRGRVLIVDDEAGIRATLARMLEHETVQAASGAEAKQLLEGDQAFDLILCDMMMSDVSGMDLHEWLAVAHPALAKQLIFITGGVFTPRAQEYLSRVDNLRLEKPFDVTNLRKIVDTFIRTARRDPPES